MARLSWTVSSPATRSRWLSRHKKTGPPEGGPVRSASGYYYACLRCLDSRVHGYVATLNSIHGSLSSGEHLFYVGRVVYTEATILMGKVDPVVESDALILGDSAERVDSGSVVLVVRIRWIGGRGVVRGMAIRHVGSVTSVHWTAYNDQFSGFQPCRQVVQRIYDFSLEAIDVVELIDSRVAGLARVDRGLKGVALRIHHVAGHAGVFHQRVVRADRAVGAAGSGAAQERGALRAMVRSPVRANACDEIHRSFGCGIAISVHRFRIGEHTARLVAAGAQVAFAAVIGHVHGDQVNCSGGFQRPVGTGTGFVGLVAGAAVDGRRIHVTCDFLRAHACGHPLLEGSAGVATGAAVSAAGVIVRRAGRVHRFAPGGLVAGNQLAAVVAVSAAAGRAATVQAATQESVVAHEHAGSLLPQDVVGGAEVTVFVTFDDPMIGCPRDGVHVRLVARVHIGEGVHRLGVSYPGDGHESDREKHDHCGSSTFDHYFLPLSLLSLLSAKRGALNPSPDNKWCVALGQNQRLRIKAQTRGITPFLMLAPLRCRVRFQPSHPPKQGEGPTGRPSDLSYSRFNLSPPCHNR